jgi:hypothetical protein
MVRRKKARYEVQSGTSCYVPIRHPRDQLVSGWLYTTRELDPLQLGKDHGPRVRTNLHIHYSNTPSRLTKASYHGVPHVCLRRSESLSL